MSFVTDFLVIGSGLAGLTFALKAADHGHVTVVTKRNMEDSNTNYAQGGIAAVFSKDDNFDIHFADTITAGGELCDEEIVRLCVTEGPDRVTDLVNWGVKFSRNEAKNGQNGGYDLGREGGHSKRRILHANDITGAEIQRALIKATMSHPNIQVYNEHMAVNLIDSSQINKSGSGPRQVYGAYILNKATEQIEAFTARQTVLATGGIGKVYLYTSNPDVATGDGIAIAYRVGAEISNMEFVQFHPTCLYHPRAKNFLISEALRGEGGRLITKEGSAFMKQYHHLGSLAPRDIVARAIDSELKRTGDESVFLDMTHLDNEFIRGRFPNIFQTCLSFGIDMSTDPIPVVPACHYSCGGIQVDRDGQTSISGLFAIGESSCTGLHGANRLASNSLLEAVVFGNRAAHVAIQQIKAENIELPNTPAPWDSGGAVPSDEGVIVAQNWDEIRRLMWNYVGIVRTNRRLLRARARIEFLSHEINEYYWEYQITGDTLELRNLATVARLIIESALRRRESRGLHYNLDYPEKGDELWKKNTVIDRLMLEGS